MSVLDELYREILLDHYQSPRNFGVLPQATKQAGGMNPSCGDQVEVMVLLEGDTIADIRFQGQGCAISTASASLMTEAVKGKKVTTLAGLGTPEKPHPIQVAFLEEQVPQCGHCINGWVMTSAAFLKKNPKATDAEIKTALDGLKCRCGTHVSILRAIKRAQTLMA